LRLRLALRPILLLTPMRRQRVSHWAPLRLQREPRELQVLRLRELQVLLRGLERVQVQPVLQVLPERALQVQPPVLGRELRVQPEPYQ
jgi:hypothetical protein